MSEDLSSVVKGSARGSLFLMAGQVVGTVVSAVTVILVARMLGSELYGRIAIAMIPVSLALLLQNLGVSTALMRFSSRFRREGRTAELRMLVSTGLIFSASVALLLSAVLFIFAGPVSAVWLRRPDLESLVRVASLQILGQALLTSIQAVLIGFELMSFHAASQVAWSILRGLIVFPLILVGFGAYGPVVAVAVSSLLVGLACVLLFFRRVKFSVEAGSAGFSGSLRLILSFGLPLYVGSLVSGGLSQVYGTLMATSVSTELIGNYSAATNFTVLVGFFTMPISLTLFPLFSKMDRFDPGLEALFQNAVKYTNMVVTPIAACLILVSAPMTGIIYGDGYPYASLYLSLLLILYLFEGLGGTSLGNLILGLGETRVIFNANVIQLLVGVPLSLVLVPRFQIVGLIASMIIAPLVSLLYLLIWLGKSTGFMIKLGDSARVYLCTLAAFMISYLMLSLLHLDGWVALLSCGSLFFSAYVVALPLSGALDRSGTRQLSELVGATGPLAPVLRVVLSLMDRLMRK
ncbi:MAG: oligosaccharide flippase family protein [Candidatus Omnitrophica bacterium]|nr:oligosaccharide flippase family protein [Candidatus Omnitrophota bacterium]